MRKQSRSREFALVIGCGILIGCSPGVNGGGSTVTQASLTLNTIGTSETTTSVTSTATSGTAYSSVTVDQGTGFTYENICRDVTIFGRAGFAACQASNILRNVGTTQLSQASEVKTYAGSGSSPALSSDMREVPDVTKDDEGLNTADISGGCAGQGCSPALPVTLSTHTSFVDCGTTQATVALRIDDCASKNGANATWNGATRGIRGEATWKLVARSGSRKEVWRDERTGLMWTSLANDAANYSYTWCQGAGNVQNSGGYNCSAGGGDQPATPISFCKEMAGFAAGVGFTDTPLTGPYAAQKGGMGLGSTPSVRWRLPTVYDYFQADLDGLRMVMPDAGAITLGSTYEWTATIGSTARTQAWRVSSDNITIGRIARSAANPFGIRCVGR